MKLKKLNLPNLKRKHFIIIGIVALFCTVVPFIYSSAAYISHIDDGMTIDHNKIYKIDDFQGDYDYFYRKRWEVHVDGAMRGYMALLMPKGDSSDKGRTFAHMDNVRAWATAFNGNPDYVYNDLLNRQKAIRSSAGKTFYRPYSRDIAEASGAIISIGGKNSDDGYVIVETTSKPTVHISSPSTNAEVGQNKSFKVTFDVREFVPNYRPDTIDYKISVDGHTKASGRISSSSGTITESIMISGTGTKRIHVSATDAVQRTSTASVDVKVKENTQTVCKPALRVEPPVQTVKVGETASYRAIYTDEKCIEHDVTDEVDADWSVEDPAIATPVLK